MSSVDICILIAFSDLFSRDFILFWRCFDPLHMAFQNKNKQFSRVLAECWLKLKHCLHLRDAQPLRSTHGRVCRGMSRVCLIMLEGEFNVFFIFISFQRAVSSHSLGCTLVHHSLEPDASFIIMAVAHICMYTVVNKNSTCP